MVSALVSLLISVVCDVILFWLLAHCDFKAIKHMMDNKNLFTIGDIRKWNALVFAVSLWVLSMVVMRVFAVIFSLIAML